MERSRPNRELVVIALAVLGGESETVHTEDIALKCHELFSDSFSWIKYPKLPDKDIVRVALTDARKEKYGGLVDGRVGRRKDEPDGWTLTDSGRKWWTSNQADLNSATASSDIKLHRQKTLKQLRRIKEHFLFDRFTHHPGSFAPEIGEIADLLRCRVDANSNVWLERFNRVRRQAESAEQEDIIRFLQFCQSAYEAQK